MTAGETPASALVLVGSYAGEGHPGGISTWRIADDGAELLGRIETPGEAGYLVHDPATDTVYAVDERKNDGRGPVGPAAGVHALHLDPATGTLSSQGAVPTVGAFPTYLCVSNGALVSANHGSFDHVEHVMRRDDGTWDTEFLYDDSTVVAYDLQPDGSIAGIRDVWVLQGHGTDPNRSAQAGGHGQASAHAHSVVADPSGRYLLVGDKGNDTILTFHLGTSLELLGTTHTGEQTGPRHIAFDPVSGLALVTFEFSSELGVFRLDPADGSLKELGRCSTTAGEVGRTNEPADVRIHPTGGVVYVNNRGEDSLAWFIVDQHGRPQRRGSLPLAPSIHPGLAARSIAVSPDGAHLLLADRPANAVRRYSLAPDGTPTEEAGLDIAAPAFVLIVPTN